MCSTPNIPPAPKSPRLPTPVDPEVLNTRLRQKQRLANMKGRAATVLTGPLGQPQQTLGVPTMLGGGSNG